ncbi:hypothetical protein [Herpetosiphon llansteffanensis]|uniref:hypothetical protein n=1 Tax=Herpetosiphon llansteffanensis TaxID=2094568 RepID=UPI000D7BB3A9|nr:hypothetical protein [Herpetosiphon llansteffanensis]
MTLIVGFSNYASIFAEENIHKSIIEKSSDQLTDDELITFVNLAIVNQITVEDVQKRLNDLSQEQRKFIDNAINMVVMNAKKNTPENIETGLQNDHIIRQNNNGTNAIQACDPTAQQQGFCWRQLIQYFQAYTSVEDKAPSWRNWYATICDNDANDLDLVLYFDITSVDPDKLRWSTSSVGIYLISSNGQNGFNFDNWGAHMCIETRITAVYSEATVAANIRMHRNP